MALTKREARILAQVTESVYRITTDKPGVTYALNATARIHLDRYGNSLEDARDALVQAFKDIGMDGLIISPGMARRYHWRRVLECGIRGDVPGTRKMAQCMRAMFLVSVGKWDSDG